MTTHEDDALFAALSRDRDEVVWSSETDDQPVRLEASARSGSLPEAEFSFRLVNDGEDRVETNPHGWKLLKRGENGWTIVAPVMTPLPAMGLTPGNSFTWELTVEGSGEHVCEQESVEGRSARRMRVGPLGAGTYAFTAPVRRGEDSALYAVGVELRGSPLSVTPTASVSSVERRGETVVVHFDTDSEDPKAAYVVTRVGEADVPSDLIPKITEELARPPELWNALAHFEAGVEEVRVETRNPTEPPFALHEPQYLDYDGEMYEIGTTSGQSTQ